MEKSRKIMKGRGRRTDHTGDVFGMITVIHWSSYRKRRTYWWCRCECGTEKEIRIDGLTNGSITSCGCRIPEEKKRNQQGILSGDAEDLSGREFGRWKVIRLDRVKNGRWFWVCKCECGTEKTVNAVGLRNGQSKSCGCLQKELAFENGVLQRGVPKTHGMTHADEYRPWRSMKTRCLNDNAPNYHNYGGRGIKVCSGILDFEHFYDVVGKRPDMKHTLDRENNNGHYSCGVCKDCIANGWPLNIRWSDRKTQQRNKRSNRIIEFNGQSKTMSDWADETGITAVAISQRLKTGWPIEMALTLPLGTRSNLPPIRERSLPPEILNRYEASWAITRAVKQGKLTKPPHCEQDDCQETKIEAHHHMGYEPEHWLDVIWLCRPHHEDAEKRC